MKKPKPILRGDQFYLYRRTPARYASVESRDRILVALSTDSLAEAERKAAEVWDQMVEAWEAKLDGRNDYAEARMAAARRLAKRRGYRYLDAPEVAHLPIDQLLRRIESVVDQRGRLDMKEADAALGLVPQSTITVKQAYDEFYSVAEDRLIGKNDDQLRRHRAPRLKATRNFIEAVEDKPIADITTDDMFVFRNWLLEKVARGSLKPASANKDITYLGSMWRAVARAKGISLKFETNGVQLKAVKTRKTARPPFSDGWIRTKLLADGALAGLNTDARLILLGMINTGYRPSEGAGLLPDEIRLDANVPHILIQPNANRHLKNENSERYIPLTGISLEAFRQAKLGFPRYARTSASLSATVNKFLAENRLLETPAHSMYSLRHAFEDRMLVAGIDERIRRDLMGHGLKRERYGAGGDMEHVHGLLLPLAL